MDSHFMYYVFIIVGIVVGVIVLKKITSCLIKSILLFVIIALLAFLYFGYFRSLCPWKGCLLLKLF